MPADINIKDWLLEQPLSPQLVIAHLKAAKIDVQFREYYRRGSDRGILTIHASFSEMPVIRQILESAGVKRKRWPIEGELRIKWDSMGPVHWRHVLVQP